jgi:DNA-binding CsgD family transcriptional regulator
MNPSKFISGSILGLLGILLLQLFSCQNSKKVEPEFRSMDTLYQQIDEARKVDTLGYKKIIQLYWSGINKSDKEVDWFIARMNNSSMVQNDSDFLASLNLFKSWYHFSRGRDSLGLKYLNKIKTNNIDVRLSKIQQLAQYNYQIGHLDSALSYYGLGYGIAREEDHRPWMLNFANNLGTVYFDLRNFEIASSYFKEALAIIQKRKAKIPPMLLNNIITCALVDSDGKEALELYEKHRRDFVSQIPYELSIFQINRAHIFWKKNELDSFKYYLDQIKIDKGLSSSIGYMRDYHYCFYSVATGNREQFFNLFSKYKLSILNHPAGYIPQWTELILYAKSKGIESFSLGEIREMYTKLKPNDPITYKASLEELLTVLTVGNESAQWKIKSLTTELQLKKQSSLSFQNDLRQQIQIHTLLSENEQISLKLDLRNAENNFYLAFSIFAWIGVMLVTVVFFMAQKNRRIQFQKLNLELENIRTVNQGNYSKQQIADRVLSVNRATHKKLNYLAQKLRQTKFAKDPEIIEIRSELNSISELETDIFNEMNQIKSSDNILYLAEDFKSILSMNQTEQAVLAFILEGHKVKEIAVLMSVSEQHVRNTKSKVFKMLSEEVGHNVTTEDLLSYKNRNSI